VSIHIALLFHMFQKLNIFHLEKMSYDEIYIGDHAFGKIGHKVFLKDNVRKEHCHIIGGTGTGKSKLLEHMIRQDIKNGKGLCLIDPHGSLYESVLKWIIVSGFHHRLVIIDPNVKGWSVGLNFLEFDSDLFDAGQHVENVIKELGKARDEDLFSTAQVIIWLRNFLQLAAHSGLTLEEIQYLLNENNVKLRQVLTERLKDDKKLEWQLRQAWEEYDGAPSKTRAEMMKLPVWSRLQTFLATKTMRQIVGQKETTVDFYKAMEKGQIVLVNLHGSLSEYEKNLLGIIIIDKLYQAASKRKPDRGKMFYVYIDEFGRFVSDRIADALDELRKRHVPFILAHQELEQLRDESRVNGRRLLASVMTNTKVKIAFRISRADAEDMALEMFGGFITGNEIKHEQTVTSFWPRKIREKSRGFGKAISEGEVDAVMNTFGQATSQMSGKVYVPGVGFFDSNSFESFSDNFGFGTTQMSGKSRGMMSGYSTSEFEMEFPFYELEPFEQVVSTTYYSIEEVKERYIQVLQNQQERYFHVKIMGDTTSPPVSLMTPTVKEVSIYPSLLRTARQKIVEKYSKSTEEIERLSEERRKELLQLQHGNIGASEIQDDTDDDSRWE
jgi:hypothetical protein